MNKHLVLSEEEYVALFAEFDLHDAEDFLGVYFAYTDGSYQGDDETYENEKLDIDRKVYKKREDAMFPEEYPCVVLLSHDKDWDRMGSFEVRVIDFVYHKDFLHE